MTDEFRRNLQKWYRTVCRDLPWRHTSDPYAIWVSEIMLQQTRVSVVIPYYERFLRRFPTVTALAGAPEQDLLAAWSGLGYYGRVRNMQSAARAMAGQFPSTYEAIRALPGIGDYTAAAVASIAFGLPYPAVDGNVLRVLARLFADEGDVTLPATRKRLTALAGELLDRVDPGEFNQSMMELGATVCTPSAPQCLRCPVQTHCEAARSGRQKEFPVKGKRTAAVRIRRTVFVVSRDERLLLWQRPPDSPKLAGFWELPEPEHLAGSPASTPIGEFRHSITNHNYTFEVRSARSARLLEGLGHRWLDDAELKRLPVSTTARKALKLWRDSR